MAGMPDDGPIWRNCAAVHPGIYGLAIAQAGYCAVLTDDGNERQNDKPRQYVMDAGRSPKN